jgi:PPOX class probable F420-dependent enzyme
LRGNETRLQEIDLRNIYLTYLPDILVYMTQSNNNKIDDPSIKKLFEGRNFVSISTLMRDGTPQITPTWVDIEEQNGGHILVNTAMGRIKQRNVSRNPNVGLAVFDQSNPYDMVSLRGKVVEQVTGDTVEKHIDKLAKKYLGKDEYPGRSTGEKRVILKIKPEHVFHMGYTAPS